MSNMFLGKVAQKYCTDSQKTGSKIFAAATETASAADDIRGQGHVTSSLKNISSPL